MVLVRFPDRPDETWHVCRGHDRALKTQAARSRPTKPPLVDKPAEAVVRCGGCGLVLRERSDVPVHERRPCPDCGASVPKVEVHVFETLTVHGKVALKVRRSGKGGWMIATTSGDDYTWDLQAWGTRKLTTDREKDLYREVSSSGMEPDSRARLA